MRRDLWPFCGCKLRRAAHVTGMDYQDAVDHYTQGACHIFAMASVRKHGGGYLIVEDADETWWEFEDDEVQNAIVHVYAVHDTPDGPIARDIRGDRPLDEVLDDVKEFFAVFEPHHGGYVSNEDELMDLIEGPHERSTDMDPPPLGEFNENDIARAMKWVDWLPFIDKASVLNSRQADPDSAAEPTPMMAP